MDSFSSDWDEAKNKETIEYICDPVLENHFNNDVYYEYSVLWSYVSSLGLEHYRKDTNLEETFLGVIENQNLVDFESYDSVWDSISKTIIVDSFTETRIFEDGFNQFSYEMLFFYYF